MTDPLQKQVNFYALDLDTDTVEELCMDEESFKEWEEAEQRAEYERYERHENICRRDSEAMSYDRN